jgi:hypothetical protein
VWESGVLCAEQNRERQRYILTTWRKEVLCLKVRWWGDERGCDWQGELRNLEDHEKTCNFGIEVCPNRCGERLMRGNMKKHVEDRCPRRTVECLYCFETLEYCLLLEHEERSDQFLVKCIYNCGAMVSKGTMSLHVSLEGSCTKSCLACEFEHYGCPFKGNRG